MFQFPGLKSDYDQMQLLDYSSIFPFIKPGIFRGLNITWVLKFKMISIKLRPLFSKLLRFFSKNVFRLRWTQVFILWNILQDFSRKFSPQFRLGRGRLLWLVSRGRACRRPAPPSALYSEGRLPVWVPGPGTSSACPPRPRSHRAAGWTSCSPDPPGRTNQERELSSLAIWLDRRGGRRGSPGGSWCPPAWSEHRTCPWRKPRSTGSRSTGRRSPPPGGRRWPACWFL